MNCPNCNHPNEDGAKFCRNCGADLSSQEKGKTSVLIFVYIATVFTLGIITCLITMFSTDWYKNKIIYVILTVCWIMTNLSILLPALAIKKKPLNIVAIILASIYAVFYKKLH